MESEAPRNAAFVSCDIVAHGEDTDHARQLNRIKSLNACVAEVCGERFGEEVIWSSGGDGGHVALFSEDKCRLALDLVVAADALAGTAETRALAVDVPLQRAPWEEEL